MWRRIWPKYFSSQTIASQCSASLSGEGGFIGKQRRERSHAIIAHRSASIACCSSSSGQMVHSLGDGHLHGGLEDSPGVTGQAPGGLAQQFQAGIGQQGVAAAGLFQGVIDQLAEALLLNDRLELHVRLYAAGQGRIGYPLQGEGQCGMAHQPDRHQVHGVEGEVEEGGQVAEELGRQVVRLIDNPQR